MIPLPKLPLWPRYGLTTLAAGALLFALESASLFERAELLARDWRFRTREILDRSHRFDPRVRVVGITDADLAVLGQWPWSRRHHGELVALLAAAGAEAIGFDLLFVEPGQDPEADAAFAAAAAETGGRVVVGAERVQRRGLESGPLGEPIRLVGKAPPPPREDDGFAALSPYPALAAVARTGFVNADADADGGRRELPLVQYHDGRYYPGLATQLLMTYWGLEPGDLEIEFGKHLAFHTAEGLRRVPVDREGKMTVNLRSPERFLEQGVVSYVRLYGALVAHLIEGEAWDPEAGDHPAGRIYLVGQVAPGLSDMGPTAFSPLTPLCYLQAQAVDHILQGRFVRFPPPWLCWALWTLVAASLLVACREASMRRTIGLPLLAVALYLGGAHLLFAASGWLLPLVAPVAGYLALQSAAVLRGWQRTRESKIATDASLRAAAEIQLSTLPSAEEFNRRHPQIDLAATLVPAQEASGDFFDFFAIDEERLCLVVADVCDKGIAAATFMLQAKTLLKAEAKSALHRGEGPGLPGRILARANDELAESNRKSMFATVFLGIYEPASGRLEYATAGHYPPLLFSPARPPEALPGAQNLALGLVAGMAYETREHPLAVGDSVFLYTDGVNEAFDRRGAMYGSERLHRLLKSESRAPGAGSASVLRALMADLARFAEGAPQSDDITAIVFGRLPRALAGRAHSSN